LRILAPWGAPPEPAAQSRESHGAALCVRSSLTGNNRDVTWGWNPDSFAAIGTVSASVIAVFALLIVLHQASRDRRTDASALASRVSVLFEKYEEGHRDEWNGIALTLHNAGPLPIVVGSMALEPRVTPGADSWRDLPARRGPGDDRRRFRNVIVFNLRGRFFARPPDVRLSCEGWQRQVLPGASSTYAVEVDSTVSLNYRTAGVCFLDANGLEWTRRRDGRLVRGWGTSRRAARNLDRRV